MVSRCIAFDLYRLLDENQSFLAAPRLESDHAEQMQTVGVLGVSDEDLPVHLLGLREPSCLVMVKRFLEHLLNERRLLAAHACTPSFQTGRQAFALWPSPTPRTGQGASNTRIANSCKERVTLSQSMTR